MSMGGGDASVPAGDGGDSNKVSNTGAGAGGGVTINIRCSSGSKFSVQVSLDSTVGSFKSILAQQANIPAEQQRLIYKGRILKDEQTLESYDCHIVQLQYSSHFRNLEFAFMIPKTYPRLPFIFIWRSLQRA
ncbi:hypothetical protein MTR67_011411 [Solanum verrucosum]|uniref:Ubiquitin-like domain-containing protein n=1 Tax=Solanum verrucosum TaxID=315347 RepID=A0AAF0QCK9_SOLVR|nr:hypothetical protein MTR67_011411 [Solanum verrucosum]